MSFSWGMGAGGNNGGGGGGGGGMLRGAMGLRGGSGRLPSKFEEQYHCYSVAYADKAHLEVN